MFSASQITILGAFLAMAPTAMSHMILANPVPYGSPNNSPLSPSGSDYPCKIGSSGSYEVKTMNQLKVGEQQTLSFTGTAVHGGGSCQLAVTLDKEPTKSSVFKVIHSIEGGCPGTSGSAATFQWEVPSAVPNGEATFAWTWFNRIGNREMYMDCAPITVSGGADDTSAFDALPDLALCNIGNGCTTVESNDYEFADPGTSVQKIGSGPFVGLTGGTSNAGPAEPPADNAPAPSKSANDGQYTQAPVASQAPAPVTTEAPVQAQPPAEAPQVTSTVRTLITVTAPSAPSKTPEAPAEQPSTPAPAPGTGDANATCTTDGELICNGDGKFGLCNHGKVVWQDVAAGTVCKNKAIAAAIPAKRDGLKHRALHRRAHRRRSDF